MTRALVLGVVIAAGATASALALSRPDPNSQAQADGCAPVATAYREGSMNFRPVKPKTIAKSLAIGNPADGYYALKQMADTRLRAGRT